MDERREGFWFSTTLPPSTLHLLTPTLHSALWLQDGALADTQSQQHLSGALVVSCQNGHRTYTNTHTQTYLGAAKLSVQLVYTVNINCVFILMHCFCQQYPDLLPCSYENTQTISTVCAKTCAQQQSLYVHLLLLHYMSNMNQIHHEYS